MNIRKWPIWAKIGLPVVILVIITLVVLFSTGIIGSQPTSQNGDVIPQGQVSVPDVVGKTLEEAEKILAENSLIYIIKDKVESDEPEGTVIVQSPDASNTADMGSTVELILSEGKGTEIVVDVKGKPIEEAKVILEELGFVVKIEEKESKEVAPGSVISQSIEGEEKEKGTEIILVGSIGSEEIDTSKTVKVPDLMGKTYEEAIKELSKKNLYYSKEEVYNASLPENTVIGMNPGAGEEVKAGTVIKITVNPGSKKLVMKDYSYKTLESAKSELEAQGFKVSVKYEENKKVSTGTIISQKPAGGKSVKKGSEVVLTVSKGYTKTVPDVKNMKLADAQEKLKESGFASKVLKYEASETVAQGKVISQSVAANTKAEQGTVVGLVISSGMAEKETEKDTEAKPVTLTGLTIKSGPSKTTYYVGDSFSKSGLAVTAKYSDGTTKDVTKQAKLSSPDMSKSGTKTVTVSYEDKTANFTITVNSIKISLSKTSLSIKVGETGKLSATTTPSGCEVTWESSNKSVATVSNGTVTGKAPGNATITATIKRGSETKKATCSVSVTSGDVSVTGVTISENSKKAKVGDSFYLTATVTPTNATNQKVTWSSSNTSVATVSSTGKVTAKAGGTAKITVKTEDGNFTATCSVTVEKVEKVKLSKIEVTTKPSKTTYNVNDTLNTSGMVVTATYSDGNTKKVTGYKCSPEKLTSAGTQTITVSYKEDSVEKTTTFTVTVNAKKPSSNHKVRLTVTPDKTSVSRGDEITYTVTMETKESLASMAFLTVFPNGLSYVDGSGAVDSNAKGKLGFDAIDWTEWSDRGASKGENYVNGYASSPKSSGSVVICTFKAKVADNAAKGEYVVKLTGLDEFSTIDWNMIDESEIYVETIPVKVS